MPRSRYVEIVPDPDVRTALSGMLGRLFWTVASDEIWERMRKAQDDDDHGVEALRKGLTEAVNALSNLLYVGPPNPHNAEARSHARELYGPVLQRCQIALKRSTR